MRSVKNERLESFDAINSVEYKEIDSKGDGEMVEVKRNSN